MANGNDDEIEMKDLLGHSQDKEMSAAEEGAQHKKKTVRVSRSEKRSSNVPPKISRCHLLVIFVSLFGTIVFGMEVFIYLTRSGTSLEPEKKESKDEQNDELDRLSNCKAPTIAESNAMGEGSCYDDPCFQFKNDPEKNCEWVAMNPQKRCEKKYTATSFVRDHCPHPCGGCKAPDEDEHDTDANLTLDYEMTIVDGVDDKDVYCEDLTQYEEWHKTKVTKNDGIMFRVIRQIDHDQESFTQGLTYARGVLFESAGRYGKSDLRILDRSTALVEKKVKMADEFFAEGITYYKDKLVQITWKLQQGFVYDINTLEEIDSFRFETTLNEGWGITWDRCNDELIVTDGSANLHFWDPNSRRELRRVKVTRIDGSDAIQMNEIEFWRGRVLANVWHEDVILVINPETGVVEKEYDFSSLWPKVERRPANADVLNGISISENPDELYFTGKLWNRMYTIKLMPEL